VRVLGGLLLLHLVHDGVHGEAEARHARQVAGGDVEVHGAVRPRVLRAAAALAAHRWLAEQLRAVEEARVHLHLMGREGIPLYSLHTAIVYYSIVYYCIATLMYVVGILSHLWHKNVLRDE